MSEGASYRKQRLEVVYDPAQVSEADIVAAAETLGSTLRRV